MNPVIPITGFTSSGVVGFKQCLGESSNRESHKRSRTFEYNDKINGEHPQEPTSDSSRSGSDVPALSPIFILAETALRREDEVTPQKLGLFPDSSQQSLLGNAKNRFHENNLPTHAVAAESVTAPTPVGSNADQLNATSPTIFAVKEPSGYLSRGFSTDAQRPPNYEQPTLFEEVLHSEISDRVLCSPTIESLNLVDRYLNSNVTHLTGPGVVNSPEGEKYASTASGISRNDTNCALDRKTEIRRPVAQEVSSTESSRRPAYSPDPPNVLIRDNNDTEFACVDDVNRTALCSPQSARRPRKSASPCRSPRKAEIEAYCTKEERESAGFYQLNVFEVYEKHPAEIAFMNMLASSGKASSITRYRTSTIAPAASRNSRKIRNRPRAEIRSDYSTTPPLYKVTSTRNGSSRNTRNNSHGIYDSAISLNEDSMIAAKNRSVDRTEMSGLAGTLGTPSKRKLTDESGGQRKRVNRASGCGPSLINGTSVVPTKAPQHGSTVSMQQRLTSRSSRDLVPGLPNTPRQRPNPSRIPSGCTTTGNVSGADSCNDKVRVLPFPLISQELAAEYTSISEPGDVVTWKKNPVVFGSDSEGYTRLAPDEVETCSILRVPPADYLQVKLILLSARKYFHTFTKRQAQKWYGIDVNKTGKIFDWFVSKGWLLLPNKGKNTPKN